MKTANASFENHHVIGLFSFHTEKILYQKSLFRAIGAAQGRGIFKRKKVVPLEPANTNCTVSDYHPKSHESNQI